MSDNAWVNQQTRTLVTTTAFADDVGLTNTVKPSGGAWTLAAVQALVLRMMGDDFQVLRVTTLTVDVNYTVANKGGGSGGFVNGFTKQAVGEFVNAFSDPD